MSDVVLLMIALAFVVVALLAAITTLSTTRHARSVSLFGSIHPKARVGKRSLPPLVSEWSGPEQPRAPLRPACFLRQRVPRGCETMFSPVLASCAIMAGP